MASSRFLLSAIAIALMVAGAAAQGKNLGEPRESVGGRQERERGKTTRRRSRGNSFLRRLHPPRFRLCRRNKKILTLCSLSTSLQQLSLRHASRRRQVRVHGHRREDADGTVRQAAGRDDGEPVEIFERERGFSVRLVLPPPPPLFFFPALSLFSFPCSSSSSPLSCPPLSPKTKDYATAPLSSPAFSP